MDQYVVIFIPWDQESMQSYGVYFRENKESNPFHYYIDGTNTVGARPSADLRKIFTIHLYATEKIMMVSDLIGVNIDLINIINWSVKNNLKNTVLSS